MLPNDQRRHRSTRRRQDAPPLPKRAVDPRTVGKTYTTPDGKTFRPSLFITLTCPSYGRVKADGTPADPATYDYTAAARDALHFAALFDRFMQNLRRFTGSRHAVLRRGRTATPPRPACPHRNARHSLTRRTPRGHRRDLSPGLVAVDRHRSLRRRSPARLGRRQGDLPRPATGEVLPTWDEALDAIGDEDEPLHVARFGDRFDAQGVLAGSKDATGASAT